LLIKAGPAAAADGTGRPSSPKRLLSAADVGK
jgi:hypothetical protein